MFVDKVRITVIGGRGGDGAVAFHREKYVASGGPDGGDGGKGGNIVFQADRNLNTLMDFRYKRKYVAQDGQNGGTNKCTGASAPDLIIKVPFGTLLKDAETGLLIKDLSDDTPFIAAKGGNGGWGNQHFATPIRQIPSATCSTRASLFSMFFVISSLLFSLSIFFLIESIESSQPSAFSSL